MSHLRIVVVLALALAGCGGAERPAESTPLPKVTLNGGPETDISALPTVEAPPKLRDEPDAGGRGTGGGGGTGGQSSQVTPTPSPTGTVSGPSPATPTATPTATRGPEE
jgi:hypothetical protein